MFVFQRPSFGLSDKSCTSFSFNLNSFSLYFASQQQPAGELKFLLPGLCAFLSLQNWQKRRFMQTVGAGAGKRASEKTSCPVCAGKDRPSKVHKTVWEEQQQQQS